MKNRPVKLFIQDVYDSMEKIIKYTNNITEQDFIHNDQVIDAVIKNILVIGEAAKYIPEDLRIKYNDIPFDDMAGMRDILIHNYLGTDYNLVWNVAKKVIPEVKNKVEKILIKLSE